MGKMKEGEGYNTRLGQAIRGGVRSQTSRKSSMRKIEKCSKQLNTAGGDEEKG
ncbi:hypothetical protein M407DRAFT_241407 [Tulasnella calospora MUT 4182]|uniref:Uncharacterized protein n=1 Tax=Tulasnella calospora MUT 4182 TaxID=1051891 RepID=A0A0C3QJL2_9AGAM|nr:hypothetical protein M407DRAFT_241407 [Tulasnella calospora MUT 4182]